MCKILTMMMFAFSLLSAGELSKKAVSTDKAPKPLGPYSQAVRCGNTLYLAGQIALDPATGKMAEGGIEEETERTLKNIGAVLEAAGGSFGDVVSVTVYLSDMDDFQKMNAVYGKYFGDIPPVRAVVEVSRIPKDARIEISCIAVF